MKLTIAPMVARMAVCRISSRCMVQMMQAIVPIKVPATVPLSMGVKDCMIYDLRLENYELSIVNYERDRGL